MGVALLEPDETTYNRRNGLDRFRVRKRGDRWRIQHQLRPLAIQRHQILRREDEGRQRGTVRKWGGVVGEILGSCV